MALEPFIEAFPERFFNVGVAEQNMVAIATGLAEAGMVPFVYSIAPFATLRLYEFIRHGPVLPGLPVRVVGIGGGMEDGPNGVSPVAVADVAMLLSGRRLAVTVEVHYINGGLGSLVSEVIADRGLAVRLLRRGVRSMPDHLVGSQRYMERSFGLSAEQLAGAVIQELAAR